MTEKSTKEERLMVQVALLQKELSDAKYARDNWRRSARRLHDAVFTSAASITDPRLPGALQLFLETYYWENHK